LVELMAASCVWIISTRSPIAIGVAAPVAAPGVMEVDGGAAVPLPG